MTVKAYTFDRAQITAHEAAKFQNELMYNKSAVLSGMHGSWEYDEGYSFAVSEGLAVIYGRFVEFTEPEKFYFPVGSIKAGDVIAISIDLSVNNESTGTPGTQGYHATINQVDVRKINKADIEDFDLFINPNGQTDFVLGEFKEASTDSNPRPVFTESNNRNIIWHFEDDTDIGDVLFTDSSVQINKSLKAGHTELSELDVTGGNLTLRDVNVDDDEVPELRVSVMNESRTAEVYTANLDKIDLDVPLNFTGDSDEPAFNGRAASADKLTNARAFLVTGDVTGSTTFDGSKNAALDLQLAPLKVTKREWHATVGVGKEQWLSGWLKFDEKGRLYDYGSIGISVEDQTVEVKQDIKTLQGDTAALKTSNADLVKSTAKLTSDVKGLDERVSVIEDSGGGSGGGGMTFAKLKQVSRRVEAKGLTGGSFDLPKAKVYGLYNESTREFLPQELVVTISGAKLTPETVIDNPERIASIPLSYTLGEQTFAYMDAKRTDVTIDSDTLGYVYKNSKQEFMSIGANWQGGGMENISVSVVLHEKLTEESDLNSLMDFHIKLPEIAAIREPATKN